MRNLLHHTMTVRQLLQAGAGIGLLFGCALFAAPLLPRTPIALQPELAQIGHVLGVSTNSQPAANTVPSQNRLFIPEIGVDAAIHEGTTETTLNEGIWRIPESSTPDHGSNTVLTAHRWQWLSGPNTFYRLHELTAGDILTVWWNGEKHLYKVSAKFETTADDMTIEQPTDQAILTLYTCNLLFNSDKRLVVTAQKI